MGGTIDSCTGDTNIPAAEDRDAKRQRTGQTPSVAAACESQQPETDHGHQNNIIGNHHDATIIGAVEMHLHQEIDRAASAQTAAGLALRRSAFYRREHDSHEAPLDAGSETVTGGAADRQLQHAVESWVSIVEDTAGTGVPIRAVTPAAAASPESTGRGVLPADDVPELAWLQLISAADAVGSDGSSSSGSSGGGSGSSSSPSVSECGSEPTFLAQLRPLLDAARQPKDCNELRAAFVHAVNLQQRQHEYECEWSIRGVERVAYAIGLKLQRGRVALATGLMSLL
jgi:hypothetical protein